MKITPTPPATVPDVTINLSGEELIIIASILGNAAFSEVVSRLTRNYDLKGPVARSKMDASFQNVHSLITDMYAQIMDVLDEK